MQEQLANLKEIPLPEPISHMPQTIGWYILLTLTLAIAVLWIYRLFRRYLLNRYCREALKQIDEIERSIRPLSDLPVLVKRVGLAIAPREVVAGLSGHAWLKFLDSTWEGNSFASGPGKLLPELSYRKPQSLPDLSDERVRNLLILLRRWIRRHRAPI